MINFFVKTRLSLILTITALSGGIWGYTLYLSAAIRSSEDSITTYFLMMLFWFLLLFILGLVMSVLVGELFFGPLWKKEDIMGIRPEAAELEERTEFSDKRFKFRIILVCCIGFNIITFNLIGDSFFDFYNKVGLHFSQLNYPQPKKKIESIESLYLLTDQSYNDEIIKRIKKTIETAKNSQVRGWATWYLREKGRVTELPYIRTLLNHDDPEVVAEAAAALYFIQAKQYQSEEEKIKANLYNRKFAYAKLIQDSCKRVNYPQQCILTLSYFDPATIHKAIKAQKNQKERYKLFIWVLASAPKSIAEPLLTYFYEHGTLKDKCLATVAFGKLKSKEGEKLLIRDFSKYIKTTCPEINLTNKAATYLLGKGTEFPVKILRNLDRIKSLDLKTRTLFYQYSHDKKVPYYVRNLAGNLYEKHQYQYKKKLKKERAKAREKR